jgi:hypothetical protein
MNSKILIPRRGYAHASWLTRTLERLHYFRHFRRNRMSWSAAWAMSGMVVR